MIELHSERSAALGLGAHGRRVTEHLGERHHRADDLAAAAGVHTLYVATPGREVAHHVAHELFGHHYLDVHNGLQKDRVGPLEGYFDGHGTSDLERHLGRVDLVVRTVDQFDPDIDHGVARDDAGIQRLLDALIHTGDVLPRDDAADDLVVELVACLVVVLGVDDRVAVLAPATRLPHEPALDALHALADGLAVSDLRTADVRVNPELAQEPVNDDLQVQLAHAGNDGLPCLLVAAHGKRGVLFGEPLERHGELLLVGLRLGLDSLPDNGLGEDHLLEHDLLLVVRRDERVPSPRIGEADGRNELASIDLISLLAAVGLKLQEPTDALAPALGGVHHVGAGLERARVHPHVRQLPDVRIGLHLEGQRSQRAVFVRLARYLLAVEGLALHGRHIERARQVVDHPVKQWLHTLVLERRTDEDGGHPYIQGGLTDGGPDLVGFDLLALQIHDHELFVLVGDRLQELLPVLISERTHLLWCLGDLPRGPEVVCVDDGLHLDEIDYPLELALGAYRQLHGDGIRPQPVDHRANGLVEVGANTVHLVHESYARYPVLVRLAPDRLGLRLDPGHGVEQRDRTVQHPKAALHFHSEVHVPGRVYNIYTMLIGYAAMDAFAGTLAVLTGAFDTAPEHGRCG